MLLPVVRLKIRRGSDHPWIYRKMVQAPRFTLEPGALVRVVDRDGRELGAAFHHPQNTIALRLLDTAPGQNPDAAFFVERLERARQRRENDPEVAGAGDSHRLVHAEADGLPGLVVDRFGDVLVIEPNVAGWLHVMDWIVDALRAMYPRAVVAVRPDARAEEKEGVSFARWAKRFPAPDEALATEHGLVYRVDLARGHKTGFFLDQRDHRARVRRLARGAEVFDGCCYTGGFSLNAAMGGARSVRGVDLDENAVAAARRNLAENEKRLPDPGVVSFEHADVFDALRACPRGVFDLVILDPPKFAAGGSDVDAALVRYGDLNRLGMRALRDGGHLVTCSCSGAVPPERWLKTVRGAARSAGVDLREESLKGAGADHPASASFPEGRYLKVLHAGVVRGGASTQ